MSEPGRLRFTEQVVDPRSVCPECGAEGTIRFRILTRPVRGGVAALTLLLVAVGLIDDESRVFTVLSTVFPAVIILVFAFGGQYGRCGACDRRTARNLSGTWVRQ